jgi:hypothetical protein
MTVTFPINDIFPKDQSPSNLCICSISIKFRPNINGIKTDDSEFLISQYTDDSTLILEDDTLSLNHALEVVELFSTCSGLRANFDQTQAVWIGARRGCNFSNQ